MIIYEVNLKISLDVYEEYMDWLSSHVKEMLQCPGFQESTTLKELGLDETHCMYITVQYTIDTKENLQHYLDKHAERMRNKGLKQFPNQFSATRRTFEVTNKTLRST